MIQTWRAEDGALNVGHGHVIPRPDRVRARCGGPRLCRECSLDLVRQLAGRVAKWN